VTGVAAEEADVEAEADPEAEPDDPPEDDDTFPPPAVERAADVDLVDVPMTVARAMNKVTARAPTHLRIVRTRRRRAASRGEAGKPVGAVGPRGPGRRAPGSGSAEVCSGVMVTSVRSRTKRRLRASIARVHGA
jgi:hypothetical protein